MLTLGIIADTHVPDKARQLNPRSLDIFRDAGVRAILHAGDISTPGVLSQLGEIAPIHAVKGNRDFVYLNHLPRELVLTFGGVRIGLAHGHGGLRGYIRSKIQYIRNGYQLDEFLPHFIGHFPQVAAVVFGHTHRPVNEIRDGKLLFNPGSACCFEDEKLYEPGVGLLYVDDGKIWGETIALEDCDGAAS